MVSSLQLRKYKKALPVQVLKLTLHHYSHHICLSNQHLQVCQVLRLTIAATVININTFTTVDQFHEYVRDNHHGKECIVIHSFNKIIGINITNVLAGICSDAFIIISTSWDSYGDFPGDMKFPDDSIEISPMSGYTPGLGVFVTAYYKSGECRGVPMDIFYALGRAGYHGKLFKDGIFC